ncbi:MAG: rane protein of unknown function [Frankiales bacterium]|nr:rane protein of unknown function [Frankiales bacterium]
MQDLAAIDYDKGFGRALQDGIDLLPKVGYFLLILIVGIILAKIVQKIITKVLQKVGFDQLVERGGVKQALSKSKYDAASILARIVYYFIFLLVLQAAFDVFGKGNGVSLFLARIVAFLPNLFVAVLVLVIAFAVAAAVKDLLSNLLGGLSYGTMLANAASLFVVAIGVFAALDQLDIAPLIVGGIYYGLLALIIVPLIIAFGVGGIEPARDAIRSLQSKGQEKVQQAQAEMAEQDEPEAEVAVEASEPAPRTRARKTTAVTRRRAAQ